MARPAPAELPRARLLIRTAEAIGDGRHALPPWLGRVRDWTRLAARGGSCAALGLRIADLQGRQHFTTDQWPPVIDVPLPAGVYHVTVSRGERQRRYTVALEQGATFELHLRGVPAPR